MFGAENEETLNSTAMLAVAFRLEDRWEEAEYLEVQVLETRKKKLGADHLSTLTSMANLASTYSDQGRWEKAEKLKVQVMETRKTKLGADHPSTLTSRGNLARTYSDQGRWKKAEKLEVQVMETLCPILRRRIRTRAGRRRPSSSMQVMETRKTKLGADHRDTLTSMANLVFTESTGRRSEAIDLLRTCVTKRQRILGPAHPDTVSNSDTLLAWETEDLAIKT
ncbi:uncharacterized protein N7458_004109 [Penicillium daleae]|uniref:Kinesin light chain n=1 Tax=Penicillium daleae TaxID=63821 RepID=A0AAD6G539_9EURO|nr:uncharacterized protein N7458_004109 [Penicillium daleae]KAJ5455845.1 hypothetical protein N7458_004109 [Penicillium daleae]